MALQPQDRALELLQEGNCALSGGDLILAVETYNKALELAPSSAGLRLNRSIAYEMQNQLEDAFNDLGFYLQFAAQDSDQNIKALKRYANLGIRLSKTKEVVRYLQELEQIPRWQSVELYEILIGLLSLDSKTLESSLEHYLVRATELNFLSQLCFESALKVLHLNRLSVEQNSVEIASTTKDLLVSLATIKTAPQFILHAWLDLLGQTVKNQEDLELESINTLSLWRQIHPMDVATTKNLIGYLLEKNQHDVAETLSLELSRQFPEEPAYLLGLARARVFKRDLERAFIVINAALELDEESFEIRLERANIFSQLLNPTLALADLNQNLDSDPNHLPSLIVKVQVLSDLGRIDEALNLANKLLSKEIGEQERFSLMLMKVFIYRVCGNIQEWGAQVEHLIDSYPDHPAVICELGWEKILEGDWKQGFELFEKRFIPGMHYFPVLPHLEYAQIPRWNRDLFRHPVEGRHLLLCGDEGLGDVIQFSRFIPLLLDRGFQITLVCAQALHSLFSYNFPKVHLISSKALIENLHLPKHQRTQYDFFGEIISTPWVLGLNPSDLSGAPYLKALPSKIQEMGDYKVRSLGALNHDVTLGLRWLSSLAQSGRSVPLKQLSFLSQLPFHIFGLHHGPIKDSDRELYSQWPNFIPTELELEDLAGLLMHLDCVITTDTMTAHLAGALGRPTILLKPAFIDWRWGSKGDQSLWYQSMQIIRQQKVNDWRCAIAELKQVLLTRFEGF